MKKENITARCVPHLYYLSVPLPAHLFGSCGSRGSRLRMLSDIRRLLNALLFPWVVRMS
jgi:hypothetical protein